MRLIDADALKKIMVETLENIMCFPQMSGEERHIICAFDTVGQMIDDATTIDAVPVVRCKDCKHIEMTGRAPFMIFVCNHGKGLRDSIEASDFCPYGERRVDDGT
jgi:hypothetical protein|nr:MAG TPA: hypothetical protein [Caudoviricetes sp.]